MKPGFTLIELLIGVAISAMLAYSIFFIFGQVQHASVVVEKLISNDARILIFQNQFEKDISGAFAPQYWFKKSELHQAPSLSKGATEHTNKTKTETEYEKIEKLFFCDVKDGTLKELTFITCNPLQAYDNYKPRIARVRYALQKQDNGSFNLLRKESLNLNYKSLDTEKKPEFVILDRIKSFNLTFIYKEPSSGRQANIKEEPEYKTAKEWDIKSDEKKIPQLPEYVLLNIVLYDTNLKTEDSFEIRLQIFAANVVPQKRKLDLEKENPFEGLVKVQEELAKKASAQPAGRRPIISALRGGR